MLHAYWLSDADEIDSLGIKIWCRMTCLDTQQYGEDLVDAMKVLKFVTQSRCQQLAWTQQVSVKPADSCYPSIP